MKYFTKLANLEIPSREKLERDYKKRLAAKTSFSKAVGRRAAGAAVGLTAATLVAAPHLSKYLKDVDRYQKVTELFGKGLEEAPGIAQNFLNRKFVLPAYQSTAAGVALGTAGVVGGGAVGGARHRGIKRRYKDKLYQLHDLYNKYEGTTGLEKKHYETQLARFRDKYAKPYPRPLIRLKKEASTVGVMPGKNDRILPTLDPGNRTPFNILPTVDERIKFQRLMREKERRDARRASRGKTTSPAMSGRDLVNTIRS